MKRESLISTIVNLFGNDINILNYVTDNLVKESLMDTTDNDFRVPITFPLNTLINYTSKLYKPNQIYLECSENKNVELLFNTIFTDKGLKELQDGNIKPYKQPYSIYFSRFNFDLYINNASLTLKNKMDGRVLNTNDFNENEYYKYRFTTDYYLKFEIKEVYNIDASDDI